MKVLISGGSGLVGLELTKKLLDQNIEVVHLTRAKNSKAGVKTFVWNYKSNYIDPRAFEGVTHIVHLAGAGIADRPWTTSRKREIIDSRVKTSELLFKYASKENINLEAFITASGIGIYGLRNTNEVFAEESPSYGDFLGRCCQEWENAADLFFNNCRVTKVRTGIVLTKNCGALEKMKRPIKMGIGAPLGKGDQYMPWIHIEDLCNFYISSLTNQNLNGAFNCVSTTHVTNKEFTHKLGVAMQKKIRIKQLPAWIIRSVYGELADLVLTGSKVSNQKLRDNFGELKWDNLDLALKDLCS